MDILRAILWFLFIFIISLGLLAMGSNLIGDIIEEKYKKKITVFPRWVNWSILIISFSLASFVAYLAYYEINF